MTTKPTHTPGPWMQSQDGPHCTILCAGPGCASGECDCDEGAHITFTIARYVSPENSGLISAAPEMLAACRALIDADGSEAEMEWALKNIRAVIAQAEGREVKP